MMSIQKAITLGCLSILCSSFLAQGAAIPINIAVNGTLAATLATTEAPLKAVLMVPPATIAVAASLGSGAVMMARGVGEVTEALCLDQRCDVRCNHAKAKLGSQFLEEDELLQICPDKRNRCCTRKCHQGAAFVLIGSVINLLTFWAAKQMGMLG
jgi:hypothetical protein